MLPPEMMTYILGVILLSLVILFVLLSWSGSIRVMMHGSSEFWRKQNVSTVNIHGMASFWQRAAFKVSHVKLDAQVYEALKDEPYGGFMELGTPVLYVRDPDLLRLILIKDFEHFSERKFLGLRHADPVISRTLTNLTGYEWRELRGTSSPIFSSGKIRRMHALVNACAHNIVDYLETALSEKGANGKEEGTMVDFQDCFGRFTVGVIAAIGFYKETNVGRETISVFRSMAKRFQQFDTIRTFKLIVYFFFPALAKFLNLSVNHTSSTQFFASVIGKNIEQRRKEELEKKNSALQGMAMGKGKTKHADFLQLLLEAQSELDEAGKIEAEDTNNNNGDGKKSNVGATKTKSAVLDDQTIIGQCFQFFNAGNDAMETTLIFCIYALALHPEVQEKLAEEVIRIMDQNGGDLSYDTVNEMEYLDKVISETLRFYPPAFATERRCTRPYNIPGTKVQLPKDTRIIVPIRGLHYDEKYYNNPETFDPENFSPENKQKRHPFTYLPFGSGPRQCIAMRFAMVEAKSAIAHVVYRYKVAPCSKTDIPLQFQEKSFLLLPLNGMFLNVTRRHRMT